MAFPASALGFNMDGGGAYPPPPQPTGGYHAAPPPAAGGGYAAAPQGQQSPYAAPSQQGLPQPGQMGTAQYPWGQQAQQEAALQQQAGAYQAAPPQQQQPFGQPGGNPAYVSTQTPGGPNNPLLDETAAGRPVDAAVLQRRASPNRLAPILVALVALLLLIGAAAAWVVMGKRSHPDDATQASASATATATAAPVDTAAAAPAGTASVVAAGTAVPVAADTASAVAAADADAGPPQVHSTLVCDPDCDEIRLDDKPIELGQPVDLSPGKHTVVASKSGYVTVKESFKVAAGEKVEKTYKLVAKPSAPAGPPATAPAGPAKPCGKFLKRCK